jgi:glycosyltransferase involved in cell wall biosynthesis
MIQRPAFSLLPKSLPNNTAWPWDKGSPQLPDAMPDGSAWPKFSIVTPSYNQGKYLEKTIRSVLMQGYPNLEYFVIDGGSRDDSVAIIKKYEQWIDFWISEPDRGQSHAINKGFEHATGDIFAWLNSDDYYMPGALDLVAREFKKRSEDVGALVGIGQKVNDKFEVVYTPQVQELSRKAFLNWLEEGNFMQPSCFFRKAAWKKCGPLREDLTYPMDVDLWLKMVNEFKFEKLNQVLSQALIHDNSKSISDKSRMRAETILLFAQHGEQEAARHQIMKMADELADANRKLQQFTNFVPIKICLELYMWLNKKLNLK